MRRPLTTAAPLGAPAAIPGIATGATGANPEGDASSGARAR